MSREVYNQRVLDAAKRLPGREDPMDLSRGYVGWGPGEDATTRPGRTVGHARWHDLLGAIQNPAREIHDFYFEHAVDSEDCPCCAGSGRNRDYEELNRGFHSSGSGRWAGWGERLTQEEVDYLVEKGRIRAPSKGRVTPGNVRGHLALGFHDAVNRWLLVPVRAAALGISTEDCFECVGTGQLPTSEARIMLHAWTFDTEAGTSRVDTAMDVKVGELEEVREFMEAVGWEGAKRRFGWAAADNMHPEIVYEEGWATFGERQPRLKGLPSFHGRDGAYPTWAHFHSDDDPELNLVFDYKVIAPPEARHEDFAGSELPERFGLRLWMTHPRKGADTVVSILEATAGDAQEIKEYLRRSFQVHGRHFAWAVGRGFGNEAAQESEAADEAAPAFLPRR